MARHLRLTGVFLNHSKTSQEEQAACAGTAREQALPYDPSRTTCQGPLTFYSDLLGPLVTAINAGGGGASGRLAESRLQSLITAFNERRLAGPGTDAKQIGSTAESRSPPLVPIELPLGKVSYPFGWYLSPRARDELTRQADDIVKRSAIPYPALASAPR